MKISKSLIALNSQLLLFFFIRISMYFALRDGKLLAFGDGLAGSHIIATFVIEQPLARQNLAKSSLY